MSDRLPTVSADMDLDRMLFTAEQYDQIAYIELVEGTAASREWSDEIFKNNAINAQKAYDYRQIISGEATGYHIFNPVNDDEFGIIVVPNGLSETEHESFRDLMVEQASKSYGYEIAWIPVEHEEAVDLLAEIERSM